VLALLASALPMCARAGHGEDWARQRFSRAGHMREALNGGPIADRSRHEYQRVIDAYRRVYFGAPTSTKADPSVVAVAELLVEMGRRFDDDNILRSAIHQYEFLRREYPGSKYRFDALFTVGEIYKDELNNPSQARVAFQEFLRRYPRHRLADDATEALSELSQQAEKQEEDAKKQKAKPGRFSRQDDLDGENGAAGTKRGKLPRITGIRHWTTPDYTRIAIDLEQEIKFESQRIDHPDRIFFDLYDTKLASTLIGKTLEVDDGFLKKIRVAQFQPGRTRIVLEVDDLANYNAFLLPNPYRLIIDIHGKDIHGNDIHGKQSSNTLVNKEAAALADEARTDVISEKKDAKAKAQPNTVDSAAAGLDASPDSPVPVTMRNTMASAKTEAAQSASTSGPTKKIVEADDDGEDPKVVALQPADLQPDVTPVTRSATPASRTAEHTKFGPATSERGISDWSASEPSISEHSSRSKKKRKSFTSRAEINVHEAKPTSSGDRSLIRALGLKIGKIVIDPGHGGHDTGTIAPNGLEEKNLVLDVAKRLGKLLETRLGADVIYTRQDDTFIPLETRTAIANQEQADLFISIHANSSDDPAARGVETYYLNFTSSAETLEVAARENAVSEKSIHELQDLVKKIALKEKIGESREFAGDVQQSLHSGLALKSPGIRDRGVKKAPFIVLIGANMPSILAEISFISNPGDARRLETPEYRQRIAESLSRGVTKYIGGLSGVKVASRMVKSARQ